MNAVIDIGNTTTKVGVFKKDSELEVSIIESGQIVDFVKNQKISKALVSNVAKNANFLERLKKDVKSLNILSVNTPMPIYTSYETPGSLGVDRLAACVGAREYTKGNSLVIDAGSCITYDVLTNNNEHLGGLISPGINMRIKSMHTFTSNLPLVSFDKAPLVGKSTDTCLKSGAVNGALSEMKGLIMEFQDRYEGLSIIIGGGDAVFFDKNLKLSIFVVPNLALEGLHAIFKYNE